MEFSTERQGRKNRDRGNNGTIKAKTTMDWLLWYPRSPKEGSRGHPDFARIREKNNIVAENAKAPLDEERRLSLASRMVFLLGCPPVLNLCRHSYGFPYLSASGVRPQTAYHHWHPLYSTCRANRSFLCFVWVTSGCPSAWPRITENC